jgi:lipopolysaccharide biosynthesis regulator YciM
MTVSLIAAALLGMAQATPVINVNVKDGEAISGEQSFRVTVEARSPITQVEFYVGSDLRDSDTSTPYEFKIDTLDVDDGPLKLSFAAYTSDGKSVRKNVTLRVDNGVDKGADFHVQRAEELLRDSKWDAAITAGRIALKANKGHNPARVVLARAYMGKGTLDRAQKYAEDVLADDAKSLTALELLAAVKLQQAFITVNRGGSTADTQKAISEALKAAAEARRKSMDMQVDNFGPVTDANRLQYVDLAILSGRYSLVPAQLATPFAKDISNTAFGNRLAFAYLKMGRFTDARAALQELAKRSAMDGYSYALLSVIENEAGNRSLSDDAMKEAVLSDGENLGVRTAQAYIALKNLNTGVVSKLAADLAREQGQRTEVNYFLSALTNRLQQFEQSRKYFERAVLAEPANADMYIERGNESVHVALNSRLEKKDADLQLNSAKILYETALAAQPSSYQALTALSVISLLQGNLKDAVKYGEAAVAANANYAGAHYALAAAYSEASRSAEPAQRAKLMSESQKANLKAGSIDKPNLEGREIPDASAVFRYFESGGRTLVMTAPK